MSKYINNALLEEVHSMLSKHQSLRDDDQRLVFNTWLSALKRSYSGHKVDLVKESLKLLMEIDLPPIESITRARRKVQELYPETRGKKYAKRKQKEKQVREQMR